MDLPFATYRNEQRYNLNLMYIFGSKSTMRDIGSIEVIQWIGSRCDNTDPKSDELFQSRMIPASQILIEQIRVWVDRILFCDHDEHAKPVFPGRVTQITPFPLPSQTNPNPLRSWLLLLLLPQRRQANTRDLDDLESNTRNISLRLSLTTETSKEDFVVLVYEVETTVIGDCMNPC